MVNQGEFIVVAGGVENFESKANGGSTSAELLQLSTLTWHKIKALPKPFFGAVAAKLDPGEPKGKHISGFSINRYTTTSFRNWSGGFYWRIHDNRRGRRRRRSANVFC